jgi:ParB/RepB/Spo0J family partition protein
MDLEFHQLDLRYEALRKRHPRKERVLLASLADHGQLLPVVVVAGAGLFVLVDGYKRVRALRRLARDTVRAIVWAIDEAEAVVLEQVMRATDPVGPLEQGWVLDELRIRFALSLDDLARRFDKSPSWVSRRLALVRALPEAIQQEVRVGRIAPHAAMKYLVPLARANRDACVALGAAIARTDLSIRQIGDLYTLWHAGDERSRGLLLRDPRLMLRVHAEAGRPDAPSLAPTHAFLDEVNTLAGLARRAHRRLRDGLPPGDASSGATTDRAMRAARADCEALFTWWEQERPDARSESAHVGA